MRWFIVRAVWLWLASALIIGAVVIARRLDTPSGNLDDIGLRLCQGDPCFKGIAVDTSWTQVQGKFPDAYYRGRYLEIPPRETGGANVQFVKSDDGKLVKHIVFVPANENGLSDEVQITAGEIVAQYGAPCLLRLFDGGAGPNVMILVYPKLKVYVDVFAGSPYDGSISRQLQLSAPVTELWVSASGPINDTCESPRNDSSGQWQGFITAEQYRARFQHTPNRVKS